MISRSNRIPFLFVLILVALSSCSKPSHEADKIVINASIWTGNTEHPKAQAMAISADTILAIGTNGEIQKFKTSKTEIIDVEGGFITPGFIDAHVHLMMGGNALLSVELRDVKTKDEFRQRIQTYAHTLNQDQWILEGNWDHTLWGGELPHKEWIDSFTKENPVALYRLDGHMILANTAALKIAGITKDTPDLPGGEIVRNTDGSPTGIIKGNNMDAVLSKIPTMTLREKKNALKAATNYLLSHGVTSVHDVDSLGTYSAAKVLKDSGELAIRIYLAKPLIGGIKVSI